uniref:Uncharacterized protein n=1 Tax=Cairina moschata TaxID=8855 RepID=A0A8C3CQM5_CAIMO
MMEQKLREEQERRRKKEMEERMSLEETREVLWGAMGLYRALQGAMACYRGAMGHTMGHHLALRGSPGGHSRAGPLLAADRAKQMFGPPVITV